MPLTRFPNGLTVNSTSALVSNVACTDSVSGIDCNNLFVLGTTSANVMTVSSFTATNALIAGGRITATQGSVYGQRVNITALGSQTISLTSALYVTSGLLAPFSGYPEIVLLTGATGSVTISARIVAGTDSTGAAIATLSVASGTTQAATVYTTIGSVLVGQGSQFVVTSAVMATVNTSFMTINFIAASA